MFENLEKKVTTFIDYREKYCILLFDELKLSATLHYNASTMEGLVDNSIEKNINIVDHAQVWLLKGIYGQRPRKQSLLYTFCQGTSSSEILYECIKK